jgi:hypothetical protein
MLYILRRWACPRLLQYQERTARCLPFGHFTPFYLAASNFSDHVEHVETLPQKIVHVSVCPLNRAP